MKPAELKKLQGSYIRIQWIIGILGLALPFILYLGSVILGEGTSVERSVSYYYHTGMRNVFVGILFAVGIFLFGYPGYERKDNIAGNLACLFALGVALLPTNEIKGEMTWQAYLHLLCALLLFGTLIYFSLGLFTLSKDPPENRSPRKKKRNLIYRWCGWIMVLAIGLILIYKLLFNDSDILAGRQPVFWLEALALAAFGISWLTKAGLFRRNREREAR